MTDALKTSPLIKRNRVIHDSDSESEGEPVVVPVQSTANPTASAPKPANKIPEEKSKPPVLANGYAPKAPTTTRPKPTTKPIPQKAPVPQTKKVPEKSMSVPPQKKPAIVQKPNGNKPIPTKQRPLVQKRPLPSKQPVPLKKKKIESESESSYSDSESSYSSYSSSEGSRSYSESSFGSEDEAHPANDKKRPVVAKKPVSRFVDKQKVRSKTESLQSKPSKQLAAKEMAKINFKDKEQVMDEILCRWWYALPLWPPTDYDYSTVLKERKLRKVNPTSWLIEKNQDAEGYKKVVEVSGYPGLFMDYENELHDLRPKETCPSKTNLSKKPMAELAELLKKCYEEQLRQLKESKEGEKYFKKVEVDVAQRLHRLCVAYGFAQKPQ